jgi:hypothetical protein
VPYLTTLSAAKNVRMTTGQYEQQGCRRLLQDDIPVFALRDTENPRKPVTTVGIRIEIRACHLPRRSTSQKFCHPSQIALGVEMLGHFTKALAQGERRIYFN